MSNPYTREYYMEGKSKGLSNYQNYGWMPDLTLPFARHLQWYLGLKTEDVILDYGAARGYLVKALRMNGLNARGMDISEWAVENCDPSVKDHMSTLLTLGSKIYDWVVSKDCLEHIEQKELSKLIPLLGHSARKGLFIVVPLTAYTNGPYVRMEDEQDATHKIRFTLPDWLLFLTDLLPEFNVTGAYHIHGIKPASVEKRQSCGFFTMTRH